MPYFVDENEHTVVFRNHQINTEVLNGEISELHEYEDCFIISHTPNKKFGYDIRVVEEVTPKDGLEKLSKLGSKDSAQKGQPYYSLIPATRLNDYADGSDFTLFLQEPEATTDKNTHKVITNDQPVEIEKRTQKTEKISTSPSGKTRYKTTLVRDVNGEKPIQIRI